MSTDVATEKTALRSLLLNPRYELLPFESFDEQIQYVPTGGTITITASPNKDIEATISRAIDLPELGYEVVPHIAARSVKGPDHLVDILEQLNRVDITDIFVPAGDLDEPEGPYESSIELLSAIEDLGFTFDNIGITGYPEGHPFLSEDVLNESMLEKEPYATYIVTQYCFDPNAVISWIESIRTRGIELPVYVGVSGVMKYQKLLQISQRVGVGDSIRFLHKTTGIVDFIRQIIGARGTYTPDRLLDGLVPIVDDPRYDLAGLHIYSFNQVEDTERWRSQKLDML